MNELFRTLRDRIAASRSLLLTAHEDPDGDAVGALLGLSYYLDSIGKPWFGYANTRPPDYLGYLDLNRISTDRSRLVPGAFDLIVLLDVGDVKRSHAAEDLLDRADRPYAASVDHHPTTIEFRGQPVVDLSIVDRTVSSTSEIIYQFLRSINVPINRPMATSLLTGIVTDTGSFSNLATTTGSMQAAARLLNRGALIQEVTERTWKNKSLPSLKLWGRILSRLKHDLRTGIVTTAVFLSDLADCGVTEDALNGFSNFLNGLRDARFALLLQELPGGLVKGSYRTTTPGIDVAEIAAQYGGGGHVKAAGFTTPGRIVETANGWELKPAETRLSESNAAAG